MKDDIFIYGSGNTEEEVDVNHDRKLIQFSERSRSMSVAPNPSKLKRLRKKITFMGYELTDEGKSRSTLSQSNDGNTEPTNVKEVHLLNGFVKHIYLAKFLPNLLTEWSRYT